MRNLGLALLTSALLSGPATAQNRQIELTPDGWSTPVAPEAGSDEAVIAEAESLLARDKPRDARRILDKWILENQASDSPWLPRAYRLRGDALVRTGNEYSALYDYEYIARNHYDSEEFVPAIQREVVIAERYLRGLRRKFLGVRFFDASWDGEMIMLLTQLRLPGSSEAERAMLEVASYYSRTNDLSAAAEAYAVFLQRYRNSRYRADAMRGLVYSNLQRFTGTRYDGSGLVEAKVLIEEFQDRYPAEAEAAGLTDSLVSDIEESQAAQKLEAARWYLRRGDEVSARLELRRLVAKHAQTAAARGALEILTERGWPVSAPATGTPPVLGPELPSPSGNSAETQR